MVEPPNIPGREESRKTVRFSPEATRELRRLQARRNAGLWVMALFLTVTIGAVNDFRFFPSLPTSVLHLLAAPVLLISAALIVYTFAAIVRLLSRMALGSGKYDGVVHVAFLASFYGFYHVSGALGENFWAVFVAGTTIISLESYHIWTYYQALLIEVEKLLVRLEGKEGG